MFTSHRHITLLYLKPFTFPPFLNPLPFSLHFCTNTSFPASYLIHNFGFSPQYANKLSSSYGLRFKTPQNPDSVLNFFRTQGFSDSQLRNMIAKGPWLLSCDPTKRVLPKFQFFLSKGTSNSDLINLISKNPMVLRASLNKQIVPAYELVYRFLQSYNDTFALLNYYPNCFGESRVVYNIRLLIENGVPDSNIANLLRHQLKLFSRYDIAMLVEELKDLGFNPSQSMFSIALAAKTYVTQTRWKEKVDTFKKWGWSDTDVIEAFRKQPHCMLTSIDKVNLFMSFWVNELGWNALAIAKTPRVLTASLERRIIPRASVVQYLLNKGLLKKNASLTSPFILNDKLFLERYIKGFKEEESYLLNLYEEKLNLVHTRDKTGMS